MKILALNIFEGCSDDDRLQKIITFVNKQSPEILLLSEANGWEVNNFGRIRKFMKETNFKFFHFSKSNSGFNLIVFSKEKIKVNSISKGFMHSLIIIKLNNLVIFFTHLNPSNEDSRLKEIKIILEKIKEYDQCLLIGDLNSLSPLDVYDEKKILGESNTIKLKKFGVDKLRYDVQEEILKSGMIDGVKLFSKIFEYTVPTEFNRDKNHFTKLRLDYIYISSNLKDNLKSAIIIRNKITNQLSDHFPLFIELQKNLVKNRTSTQK
jgi:exodeoxyribonuclease III